MSLGSPGFVAERLKEARCARQFTKVVLAELVDLTPSILTQYENGTKTPRQSTLKRIAQALNMPDEFFFSPPKGVPEGATFYRSFASATNSDRARGETKFKWFGEIASYISQYVEYPKLDIREYIDKKQNPLKLESPEIEEIANQVRKDWGVGPGPIDDLTLLVESKGVLITRGSVSEKLDAFSRWDFQLSMPGVFLVSDKDNYFRSRMDLSHELGHLILHRHLDSAFIKKHLKALEKQANLFGGAFLAPKREFSEDVFVPTLDFFSMLKSTWGISIALMIYRSREIGIIDHDEFGKMWRAYNRRGYRKEEIGDETASEKPSLMKQAVEYVVESGTLSRKALGKKIPFNPALIEELSNLDPHYLSENEAQIQLFKPVEVKSQNSGNKKEKGKIVEFKSIKKPG